MLVSTISSLLLLPSLVFSAHEEHDLHVEPPLPPFDGSVQCVEQESCENTTQSVDGNGLLCEGFAGCAKSRINCNNGFVDCSGQIGCAKSHIVGNENAEINCAGNEACYGSEIDIQQSGLIRCCGYLSCEDALLVSGGSLICDGSQACSKSRIIVKEEVDCTGFYACELSQILFGGKAFCAGTLACGFAQIGRPDFDEQPAELLECAGPGSCAYSMVTGVTAVDAIGEGGLGAATIESIAGGELFVKLSGEFAGKDLNIYCLPGSTCAINCASSTACLDTTIFVFEVSLEDGSVVSGTAAVQCEDNPVYSCPTIQPLPIDHKFFDQTTTAAPSSGLLKNNKLNQDMINHLSKYIESNEKIKYEFMKTMKKKESLLSPNEYRTWLNNEMNSMKLTIQQKIKNAKKGYKLKKMQYNKKQKELKQKHIDMKKHAKMNKNIKANNIEYVAQSPHINGPITDASSSSLSSTSSVMTIGLSLLWNIVMISFGILISLLICYASNKVSKSQTKNEPTYQSI